MPEPKPGILRNLRIKRVSLVDSGANLDVQTGDGAHIVLFKSATRKDGPSLGDVHVDSPEWDADDQEEYEKANLTAEGRRGLPDSAFAAVWTDAQGKKHRKLPIHDAGHLAAARGRIDQADIPADVKAAARRKIGAKSGKDTKKGVSTMKEFLKRMIGLLAEPDIEKRKAAVEELTKQVDDGVVEKVAHDPNNPECKCDDCMSKAAPPKMDDAVSKRFAAIEKANADLIKRNDDLAKQNAALVASVDVEKGSRLDAEMTTILKAFKATPFDLKTDVAKFRKLKEVDPEMFDRTMAILKATDEQIAESLLFKSIGISGSGAPGSAWDQIEAKADALVEKMGDKLTREQAIEKVMLSNPKLVAKHRTERQ